MTDFILRIIEQSGYLGVALLMVLENLVPPVPSEVVMGLGGIAVAHGRFHFWPLLLIGTTGNLIGNYFWYMLGRQLGYERLRPLVTRWGRWLTLDWSDIERANAFFERHGGKLVFLCRVLPTFRTMISLPAGLARMPHWRFALATFLGAGTWNAVLIGAGYYLGTRFGELERYVGPVTLAVFVVIVIGYLYRVATWKPRQR